MLRDLAWLNENRILWSTYNIQMTENKNNTSLPTRVNYRWQWSITFKLTCMLLLAASRSTPLILSCSATLNAHLNWNHSNCMQRGNIVGNTMEKLERGRHTRWKWNYEIKFSVCEIVMVINSLLYSFNLFTSTKNTNVILYRLVQFM